MAIMLGTTEVDLPCDQAFLGTQLIYEKVAEQDGVFVVVGANGANYWSRNLLQVCHTLVTCCYKEFCHGALIAILTEATLAKVAQDNYRNRAVRRV